MKKLKTKVYQYIANRIYEMAEMSKDNQQMFDYFIMMGFYLDSHCVKQNIYLY